MRRAVLATVLANIAMLLMARLVLAQPNSGERPPDFISPEVLEENKVAFRIHAPNANEVRLVGSDIPDLGQGVEMKKRDDGVWEATIGPLPAGAYRYHFSVDDLTVVDPRNPATSETNSNVASLVYVPGSEISDLKNVPHGAVAQVTYYSETLKRPRRMHIYTPPGYEKAQGEYPVLYLLHGALDCDNAWSTVGRAGFIMDNLIAAGKAKPMVVVMPAGHTGPFRFGPPGDRGFNRQLDEFCEDFAKDLRPFVEKNYRVVDDPSQRAIAGLSMGGSQTLNIAFAELDDYGYVGVFSSGIFGIAGGFGGRPPNRQWEDDRKAILDDADSKQGLKLLWFATGKDDFLVRTTEATVDMLKSHGFDVTYRQTEGDHTWINWREYLHEFAPLLFTGN
jgi:enterochelin esterase family protein